MLAREHRHIARLLASNPFTAVSRAPSPATAAQPQQHSTEVDSYSSCTAVNIPESRGGAAPGQACSPLPSARRQPRQQQGARSFASGGVRSDGPPPESPDRLSPGGLPPQPPEQTQPADGDPPAGAAAGMQASSQAVTQYSQPDEQELDLDQLMERWEAMMDAKADPLQILDTVWSNIESEPVGDGDGRLHPESRIKISTAPSAAPRCTCTADKASASCTTLWPGGQNTHAGVPRRMMLLTLIRGCQTGTRS